ncbi:hypothetical protein ACQ4LE_009632 [Meloidogyne hapla]|uniref:Uncharacterized protein n=1 Tax=Meloidogyne hapla TaxID=6305 RepID=A0A1I8BMH5_MELHA
MQPSFLSLLFLLFACIFNYVEGESEERRRLSDFSGNDLMIEIFKNQFLPSQRQKRLTLYPMMNIDSSSSNLNEKPKNLFFSRRQPKLFSSSFLTPNNYLNNENNFKNNFSSLKIAPSESIQICLFLRKGCEKLQRGHSNRLADFVQNLDVQEKVSNGFVLQRNKTNIKKNNIINYSTRHIRRLK